MILNSIYAFMATFGFGIIFNIRGKKLFFAAAGGSITWLTYLICLKLQFSITFSLFFASVAGGIFAEIMARVLKSPVTVFVISTIIPLVPGSGMYYTMYQSIQGKVENSLSTGLTTITNAGAIAVGVVFVSSLSKLINSLRKSVK